MLLFLLSFTTSCLLLLLCQANTNTIIRTRQCPKVKLMNEFDMDAYMGVWYQYATNYVDEYRKCIYVNYTNAGDNTMLAVKKAYHFCDGALAFKDEVKLVAPGNFSVENRTTHDLDQPVYTVLATDYTSYALAYYCNNITPHYYIIIVWIFTRERRPSRKVMIAVKKLLLINNIPTNSLYYAIQDNCANLNLNAIEETN